VREGHSSPSYCWGKPEASKENGISYLSPGGKGGLSTALKLCGGGKVSAGGLTRGRKALRCFGQGRLANQFDPKGGGFWGVGWRRSAGGSGVFVTDQKEKKVEGEGQVPGGRAVKGVSPDKRNEVETG